MSNSIVRLALDTSLTWRSPPVRFHTIHESIVPSARCSSFGTPPSVSSHSYFVRAEVRVEDETGALADEVQVTGLGEGVATFGRAPVLPHDRSPVRRAGSPVPGHHRFALVGDPDTGHMFDADALDDLGQRGLHGRPDLAGVVLHPARSGKVLGELPVRRNARRRPRHRSPGSGCRSFLRRWR